MSHKIQGESGRSTPSGTLYQQPGSHLSVDTRLGQLQLTGNSIPRSAPPRIRTQDQVAVPRKAPQQNVSLRQSTQEYAPPNCRVTSPFKQGPDRKRINLKIPSPSDQLMQRTQMAIKQTRNQLTRPQTTPLRQIRVPKLWKGRLEPMGRPMTKGGPSINKCKGIMAGARNVVTSQGSRFREVQTPLFDGTAFRPESAGSFFHGDSSIHQTSCASSESSRTKPGRKDEDFSEDELGSSGSDGDADSRHDDFLGLSQDARFDDYSRVNSQREDLNENVIPTDQVPSSDDDEHQDESIKEEYGDTDMARRRDNDDDEDGASNGNHSSGGAGGAGYSNGSSHDCYEGGSDNQNGGRQNNLQNEDLFFVIKSRTGDGFDFDDDNDIDKDIEANERPDVDMGNCLKVSSVKKTVRDSRPSSSRSSLRMHTSHSFPELQNQSHMRNCPSPILRQNSLNLDETGSTCSADNLDIIDMDKVPSSCIWEALSNSGISRDEINTSRSSDTYRTPERVEHLPPRPSSGLKRHKRKPKKSRMKNDKAVVRFSGDEQVEKKLKVWLSGYFSQQLENLDQIEADGVLTENKFRQYVQEYFKNIRREESESHGKELVQRSSETEVAVVDYDFDRILESARKTFYITRTYDEEKSSDSEIEDDKMRDDNEQIPKALDDSPTRNDQDEEVQQSENSFNLQFGEENSPKQGIKNAWSCEDKTQELKIQASVKPLLEPARSSKTSEIAPFPPVCYRINARPPPDCLYYFGYGVDMSQDRMSVYLRRNVIQRLWGILFGFKLRFNKRGNSREAGGFPNVELSCDDSVEGCVYTISQSELSLLDQSMGYPTHYTRIVLPTWILNSTEPTDHGVAQYCVPAVVYVAQDEWTMPGNWDMLDCSYNARQCARAGADILTSNYLQHLNALVERAR